MDPSLIIGIILAFAGLVAMALLEGAHLESLVLIAPMVLVFGATIAIGIAGGTLRDFVGAIKSIPRAFIGLRGPATPDLIEKVAGYAEIARTQGLLALESAVADEKSQFIKEALQDIADGVDGETLRQLMNDKADSADSANRVSSRFFMSMGGYAPTVGIIGTVVSLTHVLENLSEPDKLGHMIAAAFIATLWGLLSANFIWLPIGTRLNRLADIEAEQSLMLTEGMLAVQAGETPNTVRERLLAIAPAGGKAKKKAPSGERSA
ncbi:motility protein A [Microbacterium sp. 77mftsu3.1]|uniref:motility protein A n=1 Tax=Microbacterium sp. 77mftsu3.1 TaxID=1761802 RepID=UPI0003756D19|nr:MotA/TolQ/ExbB proton channel family protein [Microbacterium sp. 77mftsu3.1]SDH36301.1 chemotaxis protein MotA [Microbacterium sp. 77mftsu3.1]